MKFRALPSILIMSVLISAALARGATDDLLYLENKYIRVFINNSQEEMGRFAVDVTEGDPSRSDDDHKPLIYGHPKPWTSYTTLRINGKDFVYGQATGKRAGAGLPAGVIVERPRIDGKSLRMTSQYGKLRATQILDITTSPTTGAMDTARVRYILKNEGQTPVEVGLRTLFDTMVGDNDGAPFRLGSREITGDYQALAGEYPDFWQAFDSLEKPSVIAQGTLKGADVTPPDKITFTNWGKAADHPWDIPIEPGSDFTRLGEDELDSAIAMWWNPRSLEPEQEITIVIYYGLGGVTFSPGNTFLGISAPAEIQYSGEDSRIYTVVLYMAHRGETDARNVRVQLDLPAGLEVVGEAADRIIPKLAPEVTKQLSWDVRATGLYFGDTSFRFRVAGERLEANEVNRRVRVLQPPVLGATMSLPKLRREANEWRPDPFTVTVKVKNLDVFAAKNVKAQFLAVAGVKLADGETNERLVGDIDPQKEGIPAAWKVNPTRGYKNGDFKIRLSGPNIAPLEIPGRVEIPLLPFTLAFAVPEILRPGQVVSTELTAYNLFDAHEFEIDVKYNPSQLRLVHVSRGTMLVENEQLAAWTPGVIDSQAGLVRSIRGRRSQVFDGQQTTLLRLNFIVLNAAGEGSIDLTRVKVANTSGDMLPYHFAPVKYKIEGEKQ